ncbi:MAG: lysylphosphatidylglycerol synthase domain-containing protein [Candidatus Binatia bacterium]
MRTAWLRRLTPLLVLVLLAAAAFLLHRELSAYHYEDVRRAVRALTARQIEIALALTALSYLILTTYDALALRYLERPLSYRRTALASFLGYAFAHNFGFSVLGGAAPRYRLYASWGLPPGEIGLLIGFTAATFWVGVCVVTGTALVLDPTTLAGRIGVSATLGRAAGAGLLAVVALAVIVPLLWRRPLTLRGWSVPPPRPGIAVLQVLVGAVDWLVAAAVLFVLMPAGPSLSFAHFAALFVVAQVAGVSSHVPGGLGVFETVILLALAPHGHSAALVGALLVYRLIYYVLPLVVATLLLVAYEVRQRRARLVAAGAVAGRWVSEMALQVLAVAIFASGALLLVSGAGRRHATRLDLLRDWLPVSVLEASHFLASLAGLGLILLASGLQRRLDAAYHLAVALLSAGAVLALLKGFDYEESLVLLAMLAVLVPCRAEFNRHASLIGERFTLGWGVAVTVALGVACWFGFFVHKHTEYSRELWWEFSLFGDAPRFLRASVGVAGAALVLAVWHLLRPTRPRAEAPDAASLAAARTVIAASPVASAHLALLGDKSFLFDEEHTAFIMYAVSGRSCVAMGRSGGTAGRPTRAGLELRRALRPARRLAGLLRGRCRRPAALHRGRHDAAQVRRGGGGVAARVLDGGQRLQAAALRPEVDGTRWRFVRSVRPRRGAGAAARAVGGFGYLAAREAHAREGLLARPLRSRLPRPVPGGGAALEGGDRRLRQPVVLRRARRGVARPDAFHARRAAERDGVPVPAHSAVGQGRGLRALQPRHGAPVRPGGARRGAVVESRRRARVPARRAVLQLPGPAPLQGQVRPGVAAQVPGLSRWPGSAARARQRRQPGVERPARRGGEVAAAGARRYGIVRAWRRARAPSRMRRARAW